LNQITSQVKCFTSVVTNARKNKEGNNEDNANEFHFFGVEWFESEMLTTGQFNQAKT
jgi:hypothetical protein